MYVGLKFALGKNEKDLDCMCSNFMNMIVELKNTNINTSRTIMSKSFGASVLMKKNCNLKLLVCTGESSGG